MGTQSDFLLLLFSLFLLLLSFKLPINFNASSDTPSWLYKSSYSILRRSDFYQINIKLHECEENLFMRNPDEYLVIFCPYGCYPDEYLVKFKTPYGSELLNLQLIQEYYPFTSFGLFKSWSYKSNVFHGDFKSFFVKKSSISSQNFHLQSGTCFSASSGAKSKVLFEAFHPLEHYSAKQRTYTGKNAGDRWIISDIRWFSSNIRAVGFKSLLYPYSGKFFFWLYQFKQLGHMVFLCGGHLVLTLWPIAVQLVCSDYAHSFRHCLLKTHSAMALRFSTAKIASPDCSLTTPKSTPAGLPPCYINYTTNAELTLPVTFLRNRYCSLTSLRACLFRQWVLRFSNKRRCDRLSLHHQFWVSMNPSAQKQQEDYLFATLRSFKEFGNSISIDLIFSSLKSSDLHHTADGQLVWLRVSRSGHTMVVNGKASWGPSLMIQMTCIFYTQRLVYTHDMMPGLYCLSLFRFRFTPFLRSLYIFVCWTCWKYSFPLILFPTNTSLHGWSVACPPYSYWRYNSRNIRFNSEWIGFGFLMKLWLHNMSRNVAQNSSDQLITLCPSMGNKFRVANLFFNQPVGKILGIFLFRIFPIDSCQQIITISAWLGVVDPAPPLGFATRKQVFGELNSAREVLVLSKGQFLLINGV